MRVLRRKAPVRPAANRLFGEQPLGMQVLEEIGHGAVRSTALRLAYSCKNAAHCRTPLPRERLQCSKAERSEAIAAERNHVPFKGILIAARQQLNKLRVPKHRHTSLPPMKRERSGMVCPSTGKTMIFDKDMPFSITTRIPPEVMDAEIDLSPVSRIAKSSDDLQAHPCRCRAVQMEDGDCGRDIEFFLRFRDEVLSGPQRVWERQGQGGGELARTQWLFRCELVEPCDAEADACGLDEPLIEIPDHGRKATIHFYKLCYRCHN